MVAEVICQWKRHRNTELLYGTRRRGCSTQNNIHRSQLAEHQLSFAKLKHAAQTGPAFGLPLRELTPLPRGER